MAIKIVEQLHTIRTYPRIMKNKDGLIVMTLHSHEKGAYIHLNGSNAGKIAQTTDMDFDGLEDIKGSITLYNCD